MTAALAFIFFLSGWAALLFESLWFRQTLLAFGSSVWASALVLSSFMAGIGLGNAAAVRFGTRVRQPVRAYAVLELTIGGLGFGLVLLLPLLGPLLVPLFQPVLGSGAFLQTLRFAISFLLLLGPSVAMGATLPLLVRALSRRPEDFGPTLGALYGWNTLGAVFGAVAGELFLLSRLGVVWTGAVAAGVNLLAACGALAFARSRPRVATLPAEAEAPVAQPLRITRRPARLLAATFLAGAILLGLEVVWFRLLLLFVAGTSRGFAVMLAVVLAGIALGSLAASLWMRRDADADRHAWAVALVAGAVGCVGYRLLEAPLPDGGGLISIVSAPGIGLAVVLMLPVSMASGALFTLLGKALNDSLGVPVRSAGLLTLVNTLGAALGSALGGFVLLPHLGMELSLLLLFASYAAVALLSTELASLRSARLAALPALAFLAAVVSFPVGRMLDVYLPLATRPILWGGAEVVARREGLTETIQISRLDYLGEPLAHQLLTNGHTMSGSGFPARRYMSLFVHLPVAFHPETRDALLISYGVGTTAQSLTRVESIRSIDVVDISREILETSEVIFPDPATNPLRDPRVSVHVEDGRYFLQTTTRSFDLITGEPPPPRLGNVTYLYTQEFFQLAHDRLRPGGLISYWLPVDQLSPQEAASILGAFCAVFEECSLWNGCALNWILLGSRGAIAPLDPDALARQWQNPMAAADLRGIGVESPASLGALFLADAQQLREVVAIAPPLRDDFPLRIHNRMSATVGNFFVSFQNHAATRVRFRDSAWIKRLWPEALRRETLREFLTTARVDQAIGILSLRDESARLRLARDVLERSTLETLPVLALGGDPLKVEIAARRHDDVPASAEVEQDLAMGALARRSWHEAALHYDAATRLGSGSGRSQQLAIYAHCRAGDWDVVSVRRNALFDADAGHQAARQLLDRRGIDGCWAAAWDPDWQRD